MMNLKFLQNSSGMINLPRVSGELLRYDKSQESTELLSYDHPNFCTELLNCDQTQVSTELLDFNPRNSQNDTVFFLTVFHYS